MIMLSVDVYEKGNRKKGDNNMTYYKGFDEDLKCRGMPELLHVMQNDNKHEWYAVLSHIDSQHHTREELYPIHRDIGLLKGYIPEVCDFRLRDNCYLVDWTVDYIREIWIKDTDYSMQKVFYLTAKMDELAFDWIEKNGLKFEQKKRGGR